MRSLPPRGASPVDVALPAASEAARQLPAVLAQWHPVALRRLVLVLTLALAGLAYGWAMDADALEPYYAAAVRAFGFHSWAMVLPQVIEGVLTLLVVYRAVRRLAGPTAGLIAALVLALSPATVALNRSNISDSLMILLLALGADALSSALVTGSSASLVLAGVTVGLAFQAKMIEAWMVLPAFGLVYLLSGPGALKRRIGQLVLGGAVVAVVSVSWMTWVSLVPAVDRRYVDGSQTDSPYEQVFAYNGFGRFGDQTPLQVLAGQTPGLGLALSAPPVAPTRLLRGDLGHTTGWLLPAALLVAGWGIISRRGRPRSDRLRACYVLWGGWWPPSARCSR